MNPYLTALKPLRKRQYLGNQLFAAALVQPLRRLSLLEPGFIPESEMSTEPSRDPLPDISTEQQARGA
jgi:hypothetical protein